MGVELTEDLQNKTMSNNLLEQAKNLLANNQTNNAAAGANNQNRKRPADNKGKQNNNQKKFDDKNKKPKTDAKEKENNKEEEKGEKETLVIKVPFPNEKGCTMVLNSLNAAHAPKNSPIIRKLTVEGKDLVCTLTADNKKQIRTGATSNFEIAILALRTHEKV